MYKSQWTLTHLFIWRLGNRPFNCLPIYWLQKYSRPTTQNLSGPTLRQFVSVTEIVKRVWLHLWSFFFFFFLTFNHFRVIIGDGMEVCNIVKALLFSQPPYWLLTDCPRWQTDCTYSTIERQIICSCFYRFSRFWLWGWIYLFATSI